MCCAKRILSIKIQILLFQIKTKKVDIFIVSPFLPGRSRLISRDNNLAPFQMWWKETIYVRSEWMIPNVSVTRVLHEQHDYNTSATRVRHECYTNDTSATPMKNFDFDKDTSENIFSHPYISYIANQKHFIPRTTFWKWLVPIPKCFWSAPQNLHFAMVIAVLKSYTLDCSYNCPCTFSHSYA